MWESRVDCAYMSRGGTQNIFLLVINLTEDFQQPQQKKSGKRREGGNHVISLARLLSSLRLWMFSIRIRLFLNTLPLHFKYNSWYKWRSIFFASRYLRNKRRRTRWRRIQMTFTGMRAFAVPLRLPKPVWRPLERAAWNATARAREWTTAGCLMIKPFLMSLWTLLPETKEIRTL